MENIIAVFRARTDTVSFANLLNSYGEKAQVISTPRQVNVSCGISVKMEKISLLKAREILRRRRFDSFAGFYCYTSDGRCVSVHGC